MKFLVGAILSLAAVSTPLFAGDTPIKALDLAAQRLLADPVRSRIYATLPDANSVAVLNTSTLTVQQTLLVGSIPHDMAISPDKSKLYVTLLGATQIAVIDLNTLKVLPSLIVAGNAFEIEAGLNNRLYITTTGPFSPTLQVDASTGATEATVDTSAYYDLLEISPDKTKLLAGDSGLSPSTLKRFDVATDTSSLVQTSDFNSTGSFGEDLTLSHNGTLLCFPNGAPYVTPVQDPENFTIVYGTFQTGDYGSSITFSPDDSIACQHAPSDQAIYLFSTRRFLPLSLLSGATNNVADLAIDLTGHYLFAATADNLDTSVGEIAVYDVAAKLALPARANVGVPFAYQVPFNIPVASYTASGLPPGLTLDSATGLISGTPTANGSFSVLVSGSDGTTTESKEVALSIYSDSNALNISTRVQVQTGDNVSIAGFIVQGDEDMNIVLRAIGPSLESAGLPVESLLANPTLELHDSSGAQIASNDDWQNDAQSGQISALQLAPSNSKEAALYRSLAPGSYTAIVRGAASETGIGLTEVYDVQSGTTSRLGNISTRGRVGIGDNVMIGGFIVSGPDDATMVVRAVGPSLAVLGVTEVLANPQLDLYDSQGTKIGSNNDWRDSQKTEILATGIAPYNEFESAILQTLAPGSYTAIVSGVSDATGVGLVEAYSLP